MDNVLWNALLPLVISVVAGLVTTYIIDRTKIKTVYYYIITNKGLQQQKEHTISTLFIWCDKHHVITENDIDMAFPPCIEIDGNHEIYGAEVIREPNSPDFNHVSIEEYSYKCNLYFRQFDYYNVIMLKILHSDSSIKFIDNINARKVSKAKINMLNKMIKVGYVLIGLDAISCVAFIVISIFFNNWIQIATIAYLAILIASYIIWISKYIRHVSLPKSVRDYLNNNIHKEKR